jgi:hypothetical protein
MVRSTKTGERGVKVAVDGIAIARWAVAGALFLAVGQWPYSYYMVLRWAVCAIAIYGAVRAYKGGQHSWAVIMGALAVLFNPIAPLYFPRDAWRVLDFIAALIFLISPPRLLWRSTREDVG